MAKWGRCMDMDQWRRLGAACRICKTRMSNKSQWSCVLCWTSVRKTGPKQNLCFGWWNGIKWNKGCSQTYKQDQRMDFITLFLDLYWIYTGLCISCWTKLHSLVIWKLLTNASCKMVSVVQNVSLWRITHAPILANFKGQTIPHAIMQRVRAHVGGICGTL